MTDLSTMIAAKSDQLNADDLMGGPIDVEVSKVRGCSEPEQPVAIHYVGDEGKPWKPCKTMRRVLVAAWGKEGKDYVGRRLRLYRDDGVKFGGIQVGGIRISHMSHLQGDLAVPVNITRGKKAAYPVKVLAAPKAAGQKPASATREPNPDLDDEPSGGADILEWAGSFTRGLAGLETVEDVTAAWSRAKADGYIRALREKSEDMAQQLAAAKHDRITEISKAAE